MSDEPTPVRLADRYELLGSIGQGGMADVQRAHDSQLDREVAIKILHARYANDPEFLARFQREARSAANLNHPHIVSVYDAGESDHRPYIVMELVDGQSLRDLLRSQRVNTDVALRIMSDAALALDYAHDRGLVHRDVKPANILLSEGGTVKVTDFGIARAVGAETVTQTAAVFGTAAYMAPEQARSEEVDRRTDVYALGCVLYELLAGRAPFSADNPVSLAHKHIFEIPTPPSGFTGGALQGKQDDLAQDLDAITLKAMAKEPDDRYQTARELHADLQRALHGSTVTAPIAASWSAPTEVVSRAGGETQVAPAQPVRESTHGEEPEERRSRALAYTLLAVAVLAAVGLIGWWLSTLVDEPAVEQVTIPDVSGQSVEAARAILEELQLDVRVGNAEASDTIAESLVVRTDPEASQVVAEDSRVMLITSSGPKQTQVPDIDGQPEADAERLLEDAQLLPGNRTEEANDEVEEGNVIRSIPAQGQTVDVGTTVNLVISTGSDAVAIPDVVGVSRARATEDLEGACEADDGQCFRVTVSEQFDASVPEGIVISQNPPAGEERRPGSGVVIVVSLGPEEIPTTEPPPPPPPEPTEPPTPTPTPQPQPSPQPTAGG